MCGENNELVYSITKKNIEDQPIIKYILPNHTYSKYLNIKNFGLSNYFRGWVKLDGVTEEYCRFARIQSDQDKLQLIFTSSTGTDTTEPRSMSKNKVKDIFFTNTYETTDSNKDMCRCITNNNKTALECTRLKSYMNADTYIISENSDKTCKELNTAIKCDRLLKSINNAQNNTHYKVDSNIDQICENINTEIIQKLVLNKKLDYCGDVSEDFLNFKKSKIDAGFYDKNNSKLYLFKNTTINGNPCVLFNTNDNENKKTTSIVCKTTFPGLSFFTNDDNESERLDRLDAAMIADPKLSYVYFFRYNNNKENEVIKYDMINMKIVCDQSTRVIYPRHAIEEFHVIPSMKSFFKKRIIGGAHVGNKTCYIFTEDEFIEYKFNDHINSDGIKKSYNNHIWPSMKFRQLTSVIVTKSNRKTPILLFINNTNLTEVKKDVDKDIFKLIGNQNKLIIEYMGNIWDINSNDLIINLNKSYNNYNTNYKNRNTKCEFGETDEQRETRERNKKIESDKRQKEQIQKSNKEKEVKQEQIQKNQTNIQENESILQENESILQEKRKELIKFNIELRDPDRSISNDRKAELTQMINNYKISINNLELKIKSTRDNIVKLQNGKVVKPKTIPEAYCPNFNNCEEILNVPLNTILDNISSDGSNIINLHKNYENIDKIRSDKNNIIIKKKNKDGTYNILSNKKCNL